MPSERITDKERNMTTKEKLDLLWKYLLLIVLVYGFAQIGNSHSKRFFTSHWDKGHGNDMMWYGSEDCDFEDMDVKVDVQKVGDDSTMVVTINGETIDIDDFDMKAGNVYVKKMDGHGKKGQKQIKIITKEIDGDQ